MPVQVLAHLVVYGEETMGEEFEEVEEGMEGMQKGHRTLFSPSCLLPGKAHHLGSSSRVISTGKLLSSETAFSFLWAFLCQGPQDGQRWASAFFSAARSSAPDGDPPCHTDLQGLAPFWSRGSAFFPPKERKNEGEGRKRKETERLQRGKMCCALSLLTVGSLWPCLLQ